jgi:anti-sigma-K factor RskA
VSVASLVVALAALALAASLQGQLGQAQRQAAESRAQLERIRASYFTVASVLASPQLEERNLQPTEAAPGAVGKVWIDRASGRGMMMARDLPELGENRAFQVWLANGQERVSAGLLRANDEDVYYLVLQAPGKLTDYQRLGVTIEPAGGSPGPTGPRVIGGEL